MRIASDGTVARVPIEVGEVHDLAVDPAGDVWLADPGEKSVPGSGGRYALQTRPGSVTRFTAGGERLGAIDPPRGVSDWRPASLALREDAAGDDRVWIADGYGDSLVHCFDRDGRHRWTRDGMDTGMPFATPHGVIVDTRVTPPRLLVADRRNRRIVAMSLDGDPLGTLPIPRLTSPSGMALDVDLLWITELHGGLVVLDASDRVVGRIGDPLRTVPSGWPNRADGAARERPRLRPSVFHSPHGIAATPSRDIFITEWLIGGRLIRLTPTAAG